MNNFQILSDTGEINSFTSQNIEVETLSKSLHDIVLGQNFSSYQLVIQTAYKNTIPMEKVYKLTKTIDEVGTFHLFFYADFFSLEEVNKQLFLIEEKATSMKNAIIDATNLFERIHSYNPLFAIYVPSGMYSLDKKTIQGIDKTNNLLYIPEALLAEQKDTNQGKNNNGDIKSYKETFKDNLVSYILAFFSTFLIIIGSELSVYMVYRTLYPWIILFMAFILFGAFINIHVHSKLLKNGGFKSRKYGLSLASSGVAILVSVIEITLIHNLIIEHPDNTPHVVVLSLISLLIFVAIYLVTIIISHFISLKDK